MSEKLEFRVASLEALPEGMRQFYTPSSAGGFALNVHGMPAPAAPEPERTSARSKADVVMDRIADQAVAAIRPRAEHRDAVRAFFRDRVENRGTASEPDLAFLFEPRGMRLPTSRAGETGFVTDVVEFITRTTDRLDPEWLVPAPPEPPSEEVTRYADSEEWKSQPRNIRLRHDHSQREFEAAFAEATRRGGEVIIDPPTKAPAASFAPNSRDVPLPYEHSQEQFEEAYALAQQRGGEVIIAPE
jgi:hypothetical protein